MRLSRRRFLRSAAGLAALGPACAREPAQRLDAAGAGPLEDGGAPQPPADLPALTPSCLETEDDILGPFYLPDAPLRETLAAPDEGPPLEIRGTVRGRGDSCALLPGALLDVWHANADGDYDLDPDSMRWRGRLHAEAQGAYRFTTLLPGRYLNGDTFRPRHLHLKVSAPGYRELTTQVYFFGDPFLDLDPYDKASLVIPLQKPGELLSGRFDVVLGEV